MALLRRTGYVRQPGVVARELSPADPCAKEKLIGPTVSCKGHCERLEPDDGEPSSPVVRPGKADVFSRSQSCRGKNRKPRSWRAGRRETKGLKPLENLTYRVSASCWAVTMVNARWPRKCSPEGRARNREGEGSTACRSPMDAAGRSGGVVSDGTTTRTHRATGETLLVPARKGGSWVGRITGKTGKSADDERVADGLVVASKRSNVRGAKGPCCS
jgi:hypothetical protein